MKGFYIVIGIAIVTAIITTVAFNRGASKGSRNWDHLDPDQEKDDPDKDKP